ncbi:E3 ubiquitin-protein ligase RSL1-like [Cornus florida]|uniref:E3 ubiquitin-protein ligase RSL1-like n=1 Tax=Cornus florida TaxID=4283 RepID=UPI0028974871|nr:E3 ubiquitin-protein ligase RSL1-like [Cornus florida]
MEEGSSKNHYVDDVYFSVLCDEEEIFPISDEKYAEELALQEVLMSSAISHRPKINTLETQNQSTKKEKQTATRSETGESSQHSFCSIFMDTKHSKEMFENRSCRHSFCTDCIGKHEASKIQENISMVLCPGLKCKGVLEPELCRSLVPAEVFDRWGDALCESMILAAHKFYCPFKDCSAMLVDNGGEVVTASECPNCRRLFCAQCKVSWHAETECREFQRLKKEKREREGDNVLMELAKKQKWRRCPKCMFYVEKVDGCLHITCRCFCYGCGSQWSSNHGGCQPR